MTTQGPLEDYCIYDYMNYGGEDTPCAKDCGEAVILKMTSTVAEGGIEGFAFSNHKEYSSAPTPPPTAIDRIVAQLVNDDDEAKRTARLGLLARFREAVHQVADFGKIEG